MFFERLYAFLLFIGEQLNTQRIQIMTKIVVPLKSGVFCARSRDLVPDGDQVHGEEQRIQDRRSCRGGPSKMAAICAGKVNLFSHILCYVLACSNGSLARLFDSHHLTKKMKAPGHF